MSTGTFRHEHIEENHEQQGNGHAEITKGLSRLERERCSISVDSVHQAFMSNHEKALLKINICRCPSLQSTYCSTEEIASPEPFQGHGDEARSKKNN